MVIDLVCRGDYDKEITMTTSHTIVGKLPINLGDGLNLRRSTLQDADALVDFNSRIHSDEGPDKPDDRVGAWAYDLLTKPHPTFKPGDFTVVEDTTNGKIVSSMNLIPQTWTYAGIPFKVGRPELVGTLIEYRKRGLIRHQFDLIHQWSAQNGDKLQAITGIPFYYRLFGYEMALNLSGGRAGYPTHIPRLKEGEEEPFHIRPATEADIPFISQLYNLGCKRSLVACEWDDVMWRYELTGKSKKHVNRVEVRVIETLDGKLCGFITHDEFSWGDMMVIKQYEIIPDLHWLEVTPTVIRYLEKTYEQFQPEHPEHGEKKPFGAFGFWLGEDHPVYHVMPDRLPRIRKPYAWYIRVPDVPDFLRLITPVLEKRLTESPLVGYTGEVKITFYRDGVHLVIDKGKLVTVEAYKPTPYGHAGNAGFPPHTFLQLLFGYRSIEMLKASFADCWTERDEIHILLDALFPRLPSDVWPIS
jgi:hypothetical protein